MASLGEYRLALQMRDVVEKLCRNIIDSERPRYRYATVQSIDAANRKVTVTFPGDTDPVTVTCGSIIPQDTGQIVRVGGIGSDRFVEDVMGPVQGGGGGFVGQIVASGGATLQPNHLWCDGTFKSQTTYADLFAEIGHKWNNNVDPGDGTFKLPNGADRDLVGAGGAYALGSYGGSDTVTLTTAELPAHVHTNNHTHTINHDHGAFTSAGDTHAHGGSTTDSGNHGHSGTWRENANTFGPQSNIAAAGGTGGTVVTKGITSPGGDHTHTVSTDSDTHSHTIDIPSYSGTSGNASSQTGSAGSGNGFSIKNRYMAVNFMIRYK